MEYDRIPSYSKNFSKMDVFRIKFRGPGPGAGGSWSVRGARSSRWSSATLHTVANCMLHFPPTLNANFPRCTAEDHAFHDEKIRHRTLQTFHRCTLSKT